MIYHNSLALKKYKNIDNPRPYFDVYELQEDWGIYLATKKRTMKLKCTEFDEEFSEDYAEGTTVRLWNGNWIKC